MIPKPKSTSLAAHEGANGYALDPIIDGLIERLPPPGDYWPKAERQQWLQILTLTLDMIYSDDAPPAPDMRDGPA